MIPVYVIGEDALSCALGSRLVRVLGAPFELQRAIDAGGITKLLEALPRYAQLARRSPVLCLGDTEGKCPADLVERHRPRTAPKSFLLRFAVRMSESWVLADRRGLSDFMAVPLGRIPEQPDSIQHAKRAVVQLARQSKKPLLRREMVSQEKPDRAGTGYNLHLCDFVNRRWNVEAARSVSPSLDRTLRRVMELEAPRR